MAQKRLSEATKKRVKAGRMLLAGKIAAQMQGASLGILGKGMAPIHRKATANARRLAGTKLR